MPYDATIVAVHFVSFISIPLVCSDERQISLGIEKSRLRSNQIRRLLQPPEVCSAPTANRPLGNFEVFRPAHSRSKHRVQSWDLNALTDAGSYSLRSSIGGLCLFMPSSVLYPPDGVVGTRDGGDH